MASFAWKRKVGSNVSRSVVSAFEADAVDDEDEAITSGEVDWLTLVKKPKIRKLEDGITKAKRLREEGSLLASEDRWWEAIKKWDDAITYTPSDETIFEMKAQAYMQLNELYPALQAAEKAVYLNPKWWAGQQTLGRALMGVGEVNRAIKSFSRAIFINPAEKELWEEDLHWATSLMQRNETVTAMKEQQKKTEKSANIIELDTNNDPEDQQDVKKDDSHSHSSVVSGRELSQNFTRLEPSLQELPPNYVCMRN